MPDSQASATTVSWQAAAQGDILTVDQLWLWSDDSGPARVATPEGVALVSQTCDIVNVRQDDLLLVAPVRTCEPAEWSNVRKGRKPLLVLVGGDLSRVADLERVVAVPRSVLTRFAVRDKTAATQSGAEASLLAKRIGRAFSRFAFPDAVHASLARLQKKVFESYGKQSNFAWSLSLLEEFRISCDDWDRDGRSITVYALVPANSLPPADQRPDEWRWSTETVSGLKRSEVRPELLSLERICELLKANLEDGRTAAVIELWRRWEDLVARTYLNETDIHVDAIRLEVLSAAELSYEDYLETEALDFSTLSLLSDAD